MGSYLMTSSDLHTYMRPQTHTPVMSDFRWDDLTQTSIHPRIANDDGTKSWFYQGLTWLYLFQFLKKEKKRHWRTLKHIPLSLPYLTFWGKFHLLCHLGEGIAPWITKSRLILYISIHCPFKKKSVILIDFIKLCDLFYFFNCLKCWVLVWVAGSL